MEEVVRESLITLSNFVYTGKREIYRKVHGKLVMRIYNMPLL